MQGLLDQQRTALDTFREEKSALGQSQREMQFASTKSVRMYRLCNVYLIVF